MANEKAVLISIQPQWCAKIASGQKTFEVRKTKPNISTPFKCYIYCTKGNPRDPHQRLETHAQDGKIHLDNGRVFGEFVCDFIQPYWFSADTADIKATEDVHKACLSADEIIKYGGGKQLEFWHVSDLVLYDEPKPLCAFIVERYPCLARLKRPPQSWCYVEGVDDGK